MIRQLAGKNNKQRNYWRYLLLSLIFTLFLTGCKAAEPEEATRTAVWETTAAVQTTPEAATEAVKESSSAEELRILEDCEYTSKEEVAEYLHLYKHLPYNYITKREAEVLGWDSKAGNLDQVAPGMCIGGDSFGNREGRLPQVSGRKYYECDVNYHGGYRGSERLIYSNQGQIYYTADHYETFEELYSGEEK